MSERGHLNWTRSVYKITYCMDTGAAVHYARNAQAAISFFDQTMIAGGTVSLVQDHRGDSIEMVELRQHAKAHANADSTETTARGAAPPSLERPLQHLFDGWKKTR